MRGVELQVKKAAEVLPFRRQEPEIDHISGHFICFGCIHTWIGVAPVGTSEFECPKCHTMKGRIRNEVVRNIDHYVCGCGCGLFSITPKGVYCPNCGIWHQPFDDGGRAA